MGCGRKIARFGAVLALALSGAVKAAEPAEPLTVTKLGDTETKLLISSASDNIGVPQVDTGEFARAVSEALREQQRSIDDRCRSRPVQAGSVAAQWAWEGSCRYRRY